MSQVMEQNTDALVKLAFDDVSSGTLDAIWLSPPMALNPADMQHVLSLITSFQDEDVHTVGVAIARCAAQCTPKCK
eukprot:gene2832-3431_t